MSISEAMKKHQERVRSVLASPLTSGPALQLSRILFGNLAGMQQNLDGLRDIARARRGEKPLQSERWRDAALELARTGMVVVPGAYPDGVIEANAAAFDRLSESPETVQYSPAEESWKYRRLLAAPEKNLPRFFDLVDDRVAGILKAYYCSYFMIIKAHAYRNFHVPPDVIEEKKEVYSNRWHNDSSNTARLCMFVLISDVTEEDGPFHAHSKASTRSLVRNGFQNRSSYGKVEKDLEDPDRAYKFTGPAGTVLICSPQMCLHRAGIPGPGRQRDIIRIDFAPTSVRYALDRIETLQ